MSSSWTVTHYRYHFVAPIQQYVKAAEAKFSPLTVQANADLFDKECQPVIDFYEQALDLRRGIRDFSLLPTLQNASKQYADYRELNTSGWVGYYRIIRQGQAAGILSMPKGQIGFSQLLAILQNIRVP